MDINNYIRLLKNTVNYELPGYILQKVINNLVNLKYAAYVEETHKEGPHIVAINSSMTKQEKIIKCLEEAPENTISEIEKVLIDKGYRYSIYYYCNNFVLDNKREQYNNIDDYSPLCINNGMVKDFSKPILIDKDNRVIIKFIKSINPYYSKIDRSLSILYSTLWIYHKELNILEYRFDSLSFKGDDDFYKVTKQAQIQILKNSNNFQLNEFRTSKLIEKIIEDNKSEVHLKGQDIGLKGDSSAKLKVGSNNVMPFIGDLQELIDKNIDILYDNERSKQITKIFTDYINEVKREAKYKSRLLEISTGTKVKLNVIINVFFSYRDSTYDLYNFLESKKIDMEMMNNAIEYICKFYTANTNNE